MNLKKNILSGSIAALALASTAQAAFIEIKENITGANSAQQITQGRIDSTNYRWTRDNVYILTRCIFIEPGKTLTIEPGTIIRGVKAGAIGSDIAAEPGNLTVSRDAKLVANGTPDDPIVMTSIDDPNVIGGAATIPGSYVNSTGATKTVTAQDYSADGATSTNGFAYNQQWGGLVVLGNAYVSNYNVATPSATIDVAPADGLPDDPHTLADPTAFNTNGVGRDYIEGLDPATIPSAGNLGIYGNKTDTDNSGVFRFVSVRYGGFKIGANNEINAFTTGGIGSNTAIEFVEAAFNVDDGFEFFGGKNNTRHLYANYIMDDSFDADEGFRGTQQFWFVIQGNTTVARSGFPVNNTLSGVTFTDTQFERLFEIDGAENDNNSSFPRTDFDVFNLTMLSGGITNNSIRIRLDAQVDLNNVVGEKLARVAADNPVANKAVDGTPGIGTDANVANFHYFFNADLASLEQRTFDDDTGIDTSAIEELTSQVVDNSFYKFLGTDPRLAVGSAARTEDGPLPPAGFVQVNYAGYMRDNTFLKGWSVLDYLDSVAATNVARPVLSIAGLPGANPVVSFASAGASIKYVIEKSTNRRVWTPVNSGTPVAGAGTITFTDTSETVTAGTPVHYRAYAL